MIKKILPVVFGLFCGVTSAQEGTISPYSHYGLGEQKFRGINEIKDMGGLAVYSDSLRINTLNPASYGQLQRVTIAMGASMHETKVQNNTSSYKTNTGSINYIALAVPVGKVGIAAGVSPYTFTGYKITDTFTENNIEYNNRFNGKGGINRAFVGAGYNVMENFSVGAEVGIFFGTNEKSQVKFIQDDGNEFPVQYGTVRREDSRYTGFSYNFSAQYKHPLSKRKFLYANATFSPESQLDRVQNRSINLLDANYAIVQSSDLGEVQSKVTHPQNYSIGLGIGDPFKWFVGAEYAQRKTSVWNQIFTYSNATYQDAYRVSVGGFYTPKFNSFTSLLSRMTYRAGFRYESTGLMINNVGVEEKAVTAGVGIPVGRFASNLNIGFEYGTRGALKNDMVKENYIAVSVGISLNDRWFEKRKFE